MLSLDFRSGYFQLAVNPSDVVKTAFVTKNGSTGLTLNKEKCKFGCDKLKYLGLMISKDGITTDETKVRAIVETKPPKNSKDVSKFSGMSQW
ncbi:hypothetical protein TNCV_628401 [Trichonephila clavipes]|nr:hypothetical protein TNCV_628401 [Trichonephila clavipes]